MFKGIGVALVTPFDDYRIDFTALGKVVDHVIQGGVDFLVPLGSTGEASTLTDEEQRAVLDYVIEHVDGRVPVVAGNFGGNDTRALGRKLKSWHFDGIAAILSSSPSYNKPTQEGIFRHYQYLADQSDISIIVYNVPGRTASNIEAENILKMAEEIPNVVAIKEASTKMDQIKMIIDHKPEDFLVLSGDDPTALETMKLGADGLISVIGNAYPKKFATLIHAALKGNWAVAEDLDSRFMGIHPHLYIEGNPTGIKAVLHHQGLCAMDVRLPLLTMSEVAFKSLLGAIH